MNSYLAVAIGGAIGALLRFAISEWVGGSQATLLVNAVGSLLLGMCMAGLAANLMSEELTIFSELVFWGPSQQCQHFLLRLLNCGMITTLQQLVMLF